MEAILHVAEPKFEAGLFWADNCKTWPSSQTQIIGLDWEQWSPTDVEQTAEWVGRLRKILAQHHQLPLTTILVVGWPEEIEPRSVKTLTKFQPLVAAGATFRYKAPRFYPLGKPFAEALRGDLSAHGLLEPRVPDKEGYRPAVDRREDDDDQRARLNFYGDPPFRWKAHDINELFGLGPQSGA